MVRTKADTAGVKVVGAKALRKTMITQPSGSSTTSSDGKGKPNSGGNSYCPRETPVWQKEITKFFTQAPGQATNGETENLPEKEKQEETQLATASGS